MSEDEAFVHEVYASSYDRLVGQVFCVCGDQAAAEDAVQEAFVRAVVHAGSFRRTDNPEAWLCRVALNVQKSRWRRLKTYAGLRHKLPRPSATPELSPDHIALVAALRELPLNQREAIVLHHVADLTVAEVAATLGVAEGTIKARLSRGRTALAGLLSEDEEDSRHA